jgi:hypothetical protein
MSPCARVSTSIVAMRVVASFLVLAACAQHAQSTLRSAEEIALPVHYNAWPRQLDNDLLVHVVQAANAATIACAGRVVELETDVTKARRTSRWIRFATGLSAVVAGSLAAAAPLVSDARRPEYTTWIAIGGAGSTGFFAAYAQWRNADERMQQNNRRLGEIKQALRAFAESWLRLLADHTFAKCEPEDQQEPDQKSLEAEATLWVPTSQDPKVPSFKWEPRTAKEYFAPFLTGKRCLLPRDEQEKLHLGLVVETERLMHACVGNTDVTDASLGSGAPGR